METLCGGPLIKKTNEDGEEFFGVKEMDEFEKIAPNLCVIARARPEDKYLLVTGL